MENWGRTTDPRSGLAYRTGLVRDQFSTTERIRSFVPRRDSEVDPRGKTDLKSTNTGNPTSLHNHLSRSDSQDEATARKTQLTRRSGCLNTSCFFPNRLKRLPSESRCSVSLATKPAGQAYPSYRQRCTSKTTPTAIENTPSNSTTTL